MPHIRAIDKANQALAESRGHSGMNYEEQITQRLPITTRQFSRPGVLSRKLTIRMNIIEILSIAFLVLSICVALAMVSLLPLPNVLDKVINAAAPTQVPCAKAILISNGDGTNTLVIDRNCPVGTP